MNESLDGIINLVRTGQPDLVYLRGDRVDTAASNIKYSAAQHLGFQSFQDYPHPMYISPGFEYLLMETKVNSNNEPITYYLDSFTAFIERLPPERSTTESSDRPLGPIRLMRTQPAGGNNRARWTGTVIDGHLLVFVTRRSELLALLHLDLNQSEFPPQTGFDAVNPLLGPEIVEAPIELIPGATSTIRIRIPEYLTLEQLPESENVQLTREGNIVTLVYDNDRLIRKALERLENTSTFDLYGVQRTQISQPRPDQIVDHYRQRSIPFYEHFTGFEAVGVPILIQLREGFPEIQGPVGFSRMPIHGRGTGQPTAVMTAILWQTTGPQVQWLSEPY